LRQCHIVNYANHQHSPLGGTTFQTPFSPVSFGKSFMKIRSAVPENGSHFLRTDKKQKKNKKNICKTYTLPPIFYRLIGGYVNYEVRPKGAGKTYSTSPNLNMCLCILQYVSYGPDHGTPYQLSSHIICPIATAQRAWQIIKSLPSV